MTTLKRRPMLLCAICFLLGVVIADALQPGYVLPGLLCIAAVAATVLTARHVAPVSSASVLLAFLFLGVFLHSVKLTVPADDISHFDRPARRTIEGTVVTAPESKFGRQVFRVRVSAIGPADGRRLQPASGLAVVRAPLGPAVGLGHTVRLENARVKRPRTSREPGSFDYRAWLRRRGVTAEIRCRTVTPGGSAESGGFQLARFGLTLRKAVNEGIEGNMPGAAGKLHAQLLMSMVYGLEAAPLPDAVVEEFRRAGTVHLLVVSGAQVTMLVAALLWLTGARLTTVRWWHIFITGGALLVLVLIVGLGASVARAVAMFVLLMMAALGSRDYDLPTAIALAALVICIADTNALFSLSFQLTFAATIGVSAFIPSRPALRGDAVPMSPSLRILRSVAWGTLGAWALATPLLAHHFRAFALLGNVANLVNVPLSGVTMFLGFLALPLALAVTVPWLAWLKIVLVGLCGLSRIVLDVVMYVNSLAGSLPVSYVDDLHLTTWQCLLWYALVALLVMSGLMAAAQRPLDVRLSRMHPRWPAIALICLVAAVALGHGLSVTEERDLKVTFLPVGAGQCVVVRAPCGASMMIDCGGRDHLPGSGRDLAEDIIEPYLTGHGIRCLDFVLITHWDADHFNALPHLLDHVAVDTVIVPPQLPDAAPPPDLPERLRGRSAPARSGVIVHLGEGVAARTLAPRRPFLTGTEDDANNNSVVVRLTYGEMSFLFTGDLEADGIKRLLRDSFSTHRTLGAQVLQLPHHGRPMEGIERMLDAVGPTWAVASTGSEARYYLRGGVSQALARRGIRLLRTDVEGAVTFTTDGRDVRVNTTRQGEIGAVAVGCSLSLAAVSPLPLAHCPLPAVTRPGQ